MTYKTGSWGTKAQERGVARYEANLTPSTRNQLSISNKKGGE